MSAVNLEEARRFCGWVDPTAEEFDFRTFYPKEKPDAGQHYPRNHRGSLNDKRFAETLIDRNEDDYGVYLTVNRTDGRGTTADHITDIRAVWAELDKGMPAGGFPLQPSFIVETSPGKFHVYWLLQDEMTLQEFAGVMARLVQNYGADPNATDVARVLRVPGFAHTKGEPFLCRIAETTDDGSGVIDYTAAKLLRAFPPVERKRDKPPKRADGVLASLTPVSGTSAEDVGSMLEEIPGSWWDERENWRVIGAALHHWSGGSEEGYDLWCKFASASSKFDEKDSWRVWRSFSKEGSNGKPTTIRTLAMIAKEHGWAQPGRKHQRDRGTEIAADDVKPDPDKAGQREVKLTWLDNVKPEPTEWLWFNCIVRGGLNAWSGNPGGGKSQLSYDAAARATTGRPWPGERENSPLRKPGRVIILDAENKTANDIVPRLLAAGADLSKVAVIDSVLRYDDKGNPVTGFLSLQTDIAELDRKLTTLRDVALIIIDPISAYLGTAKSHNDAEVRGVLGPLSKLAEKHNVAVLYICHLNKGSDPNAIYRTQGSVAFIAAARSAFGVSIHPEDKDSDDPRRIFGPVKTNLAKKVPAFAFKIESAEARSKLTPLPIPTSRVHWLGRSDVSIEDALSNGQRKKTTEERACDWLRDQLAEGETSTKYIYKAGENEGFNQRLLQRAADKLGVERSARSGFQGSVTWSLPRKEERRQRATLVTTYH